MRSRSAVHTEKETLFGNQKWYNISTALLLSAGSSLESRVYRLGVSGHFLLVILMGKSYGYRKLRPEFDPSSAGAKGKTSG